MRIAYDDSLPYRYQDLYVHAKPVLSIERKDAAHGAMLRLWLDQHVIPEFSGRTLSVDIAVAERCARLHIPDKRGVRGALIAATALVHGMAVVTRNVADFAPTGVTVINPWEASH